MDTQEDETSIFDGEEGNKPRQVAPQLLTIPAVTMHWRKESDQEDYQRLLLAQLYHAQHINAKGIRPFSFHLKDGALQIDAKAQTPIQSPAMQSKVAQQFVTHHRHLNYEQTHAAHQEAGSHFRDR